MRQRQTVVLTILKDQDASLDGLHGRLEDVRTGREAMFSSWDQLHNLLDDLLVAANQPHNQTSPSNSEAATHD